MTSISGPFGQRRPGRRVFFNRSELSLILTQYAVRVRGGEWRDYAIDHDSGAAVFSVFRHTLDRPLFRIVKTVTAEGEAAYAVFTGPRQLAAGARLPEVLAVFDRLPRVIAGGRGRGQ